MTDETWRADVKHALRDAALEARKSRLPAAISSARQAVQRHVLRACDQNPSQWRTVAAFIPLPTEVGSRELLDGLVARGARVIVPVTLADRDLDWTAWPGSISALIPSGRESTLVRPNAFWTAAPEHDTATATVDPHGGTDSASSDPHRPLPTSPWASVPRLGLDAIAAADVVLVPALSVDLRGVRLGRGGGSYDRALERIRPGTPLVALLYDDEIVTELPADGWDVPVTDAVTPAGWTRLGPPESESQDHSDPTSQDHSAEPE